MHECIPCALGFEDEFGQLPDGAAAAGEAGLPVSIVQNLRIPVCGSRGEAHSHQKRQIGDVVAHVGDLLVGETGLLKKRLVGGGLEALALGDAGDAELPHALGDDRRGAARDDRDLDAVLL